MGLSICSLVFLYRIWGHQCEEGYMYRRLEEASKTTALDEVGMLADLADNRFVAVSKKTESLVFSGRKMNDSGLILATTGNDDVLSVPIWFVVLSRGRWWWVDALLKLVFWVVAIVVSARITIAIGG